MSPARETSTDTTNWPTNTEAALRLGANERTIRRYIDAGRLRSSTRPRKGAKPVVIVHPEDLERLRGERQPAVAAMVQAVSPTRGDLQGDTARADSDMIHPARIPADSPAARGPAEISLRIPTAGVALQHFLAGLFEAFPIQPQKVFWLSLEEAVEVSGLTRRWLVEWAESGAGTVAVRDMGKHARGGRWRFNRDALKSC